MMEKGLGRNSHPFLVYSKKLYIFTERKAVMENKTISIRIGEQDWFLRKMGDTTHFLMANTREALDTGAAAVWHIGQQRGQQYYGDVRSWLKGGESPDGKIFKSIY